MSDCVESNPFKSGHSRVHSGAHAPGAVYAHHLLEVRIKKRIECTAPHRTHRKPNMQSPTQPRRLFARPQNASGVIQRQSGRMYNVFLRLGRADNCDVQQCFVRESVIFFGKQALPEYTTPRHKTVFSIRMFVQHRFTNSSLQHLQHNTSPLQLNTTEQCSQTGCSETLLE